MAAGQSAGGGPGTPPSIIIITLDCVRPDFLGCYGCRSVRTPHLDRMAARGIVFDQAVSQAPNTWVSHAGIFTGCYPPEHGLRTPYDRILSGIPTLASLLRGRGYRTAGFPGNDLAGSRMGFADGFDLFFEEYREPAPPDAPPGPAPPGPAEVPGDPPRISANVRNDWEGVLAAAERWLSRERAAAPVFLWFHYLDTHHLPDLSLPEYYRYSRDPNWQFYEGKISYADERCLGAVLNLLQGHGLYEDALFAVLSDHGEGLRPGEPPRHNGELSEEVLRVPLVLFGERMPARGLRVAGTVRTADLAPTFAALAGAVEDGTLPAGSGAVLPLPGLLPCPADLGAPQPAGNTAYGENEPLGLSCVRSGEWKYRVSGGRESLFHLPADPAEANNVIRRHPETADSLRLEHDRVRSLGPGRREAADREERETRRILSSLGYVE